MRKCQPIVKLKIITKLHWNIYCWDLNSNRLYSSNEIRPKTDTLEDTTQDYSRFQANYTFIYLHFINNDDSPIFQQQNMSISP